MVIDFIGDIPKVGKDFKSLGLELLSENNNKKEQEIKIKDRKYLELKVDKGCFRKTVYEGLSWDSLYIGFQVRIYRYPDEYHKYFWNHFFCKLPGESFYSFLSN